ncbi:MAG: hypothetical protein P8M21_03520 [Halioglobus sp.]|nr:hypothetical protein [Halioglobus sp.]
MDSGSQEMRRLAYLDALGVDTYVSRGQLPGAAPTRRLAIVPPVQPAGRPESSGQPAAPPMPRPNAGQAARSSQPDSAAGVTAVTPAASVDVPRFSLTAIQAGNWLWVEELAGMPLTTEQVQLVKSMAGALGHAEGSVKSALGQPQVQQFDWPMHSNQQLDQGEASARAAVAGFIGRKLEESGCRGLVMMGGGSAQRVSDLGFPSVKIESSAELLQRPDLKPAVWRALLALVTAA